MNIQYIGAGPMIKNNIVLNIACSSTFRSALIHPSWTHYSQTHRGPSARDGAFCLPCGPKPGACGVPQQEFPSYPCAKASSWGGSKREPSLVSTLVPASQSGRSASRLWRVLTVLSHRCEPHVWEWRCCPLLLPLWTVLWQPSAPTTAAPI